MGIRYKPSQFNIVVPVENHTPNTYVYNTYTDKGIFIPKIIVDRAELIPANSALAKTLLDAGVIIPDTWDETLRIKDEMRQIKNSYGVLAIVIAPTMACNYKCKYCFEHNTLCNNSNMTKETMDATIDFIKSQVENHKQEIKKLQLKWFGGEPLINSEAIPYITQRLIEEVLKPNHLMFQATMFSNCRLLTPEVAQMLKENNVSNITVTIDGLEETYIEQKGCTVEDYKITLSNLKNAQGILNNISIAINVTERNIDEIPETIKYIRSLGINWQIVLNKVICYTDNETDNNSISHSKYIEINKAIEGMNNVIVPSPAIKKVGCEAIVDFHYIIGPDGNIYKCEHMLNKPEYSIGNVFNREIHASIAEDIWSNPEIPKECLECSLLPVCGASMCLTNYHLYNTRIDCDKQKEYVINTIQRRLNTST